MIDVPVVSMFVAAVVSGFIGALVGAAALALLLRKGKLVVRAVELPRRILALDNLSLSVTIKGENGRIMVTAHEDVRADSLAASAVEGWLEDNGLVAQFKGTDFKVPAPAGNPWQETR